MSKNFRKKVYEYTKEGKYVKMYESIGYCRRANYNDPGYTGQVVNKNHYGVRYGILPNGNYVVLERLGRKGIHHLHKKINSDNVLNNKNRKNIRNIVIKNLDGEFLFVARNKFALELLIDASPGHIWQALEKGGQVRIKDYLIQECNMIIKEKDV